MISIITRIILKNYYEDNDDDDDDENTPGPFAPPGRSRPSLKMTALSYSCTTCIFSVNHPAIKIDLDGDLYAEAEGEGHGGDDEEEGEKGEEESTASRTLGIRFK